LRIVSLRRLTAGTDAARKPDIGPSESVRVKASSHSNCRINNNSKNNRNRRVAGDGQGHSPNRSTCRLVWPALIALGSGYGLTPDNAAALELGDLRLHSSIGQPLRASIAYALGPNESIQSHCIYLRPADRAAGLPGIRNARINVANGAIRVTGRTAVRDPLLSLQLMVDCPGTANLSRQYTVFVDPSPRLPAASPEATAATFARSGESAAARSAPRVTERASRAPAAPADPIRAESTYRVRPGDSLSGIAARIGERNISIWQAVDVIFAANPDAFVGNDRNRLKAGSVLVLPNMGTVAAVSGTAGNTRSAATSTPEQPAASGQAAIAVQRPVERVSPRAESAPAAGSSPSLPSPSLRGAGGAAIDPDNPFVAPAEAPERATIDNRSFGPARESIADTRVDAAVTPRVVVSNGASTSGEGWGWLAWLGGSGIAIILGLLLFGRQLKDRFAPAGAALVHPGRRRTDAGDTRIMPAPQRAPIAAGDLPRQVQPAVLDGDLESGESFDYDDIDLAQEFGFSTSRDLYGSVDVELSEFATSEPERPSTDIIPPQRFSESLILENEIPPSDDTGEYDMSMIVDATRQAIDDDDTAKDLQAVQLDTGDNEALNVDDDTLSKAVEYKILEQDYEAELTATQALNAEMLKAAKAAADSRDAGKDSEAPTAEFIEIGEDLTAELPESFDGDRTTEMPAEQDAVAIESEPVLAIDDSGVNAEITRELPAADNDATVDMDIESATVDTKKLRAS
jgi:FimV-like protein